jgi:hypothetical protein
MKAKRVKRTEKMVARAHTRDSVRALGKLTTVAGGQRRIISDPPLIEPIEQMIPSGTKVYARICGWTLARAHARSGDRIALAAYLGGSAKFDQAITDFAETYADQNERDYAALQAAVKDGRAEATTEI